MKEKKKDMMIYIEEEDVTLVEDMDIGQEIVQMIEGVQILESIQEDIEVDQEVIENIGGSIVDLQNHLVDKVQKELKYMNIEEEEEVEAEVVVKVDIIVVEVEVELAVEDIVIIVVEVIFLEGQEVNLNVIIMIKIINL